MTGENDKWNGKVKSGKEKWQVTRKSDRAARMTDLSQTRGQSSAGSPQCVSGREAEILSLLQQPNCTVKKSNQSEAQNESTQQPHCVVHFVHYKPIKLPWSSVHTIWSKETNTNSCKTLLNKKCAAIESLLLSSLYTECTLVPTGQKRGKRRIWGWVIVQIAVQHAELATV